MKQQYSKAVIEQAVIKLLSRGKRKAREVERGLDVNYYTAKNWMKKDCQPRQLSINVMPDVAVPQRRSEPGVGFCTSG